MSGPVKRWLEDYRRCWELDPFQHLLSLLCIPAAVGLAYLFWMAVRGLV